jgi:hypothetical protein
LLSLSVFHLFYYFYRHSFFSYHKFSAILRSCCYLTIGVPGWATSLLTNDVWSIVRKISLCSSLRLSEDTRETYYVCPPLCSWPKLQYALILRSVCFSLTRATHITRLAFVTSPTLDLHSPAELCFLYLTCPLLQPPSKGKLSPVLYCS